MKKFSLAPLAGAIALILSSPAMAEQDQSGTGILDVEQGAMQKPAPIRSLEREGLIFHETFEVEGELTGYAMSMEGQPVPVFVTGDGKRALIGTMIDEDGNDLVQEKLTQIVQGPVNDAAWEMLVGHDVVVEGDPDAPNVMYTITDPNCPYCHRQWQSAKPLVDAGKLQVRHVMVGMLAEDSAGKSAAILQSDDPAAAMREHQLAFEEGGIAPAETIEGDTQEVIDKGMELMQAANVTGTPASFYKDDEGQVQRIGGAVPTEELIGRFDIAM